MPAGAVLLSLASLQQSVAPLLSVVWKLSALLTSLQKPMYCTMSKEELENSFRDVFHNLKVTSVESLYLKECTQLQTQSYLWRQHRVGWITFSLFKRAMRASHVNPSSSIIRLY